MTSFSNNFRFPSLLPLPAVFALIAYLGGAAIVGEENEKEKPKPRPEKGFGMGDLGKSRERWESMSPEDREKLKVALREVWTDPGVLSAREEVNQASKAFQDAIRAAIEKADPSVAGILTELQSESRGPGQGRPGSPGSNGRFGPRRSGEYPMGSPGFFEKLTPEQRKKFKEAEDAARESDAVLKWKDELGALQKQDEQLRRQRMETHMKMRKAVLQEMVQQDPDLKEILAELEIPRGGKGSLRKEGDRKPEKDSAPSGKKPNP